MRKCTERQIFCTVSVALLFETESQHLSQGDLQLRISFCRLRVLINLCCVPSCPDLTNLLDDITC